MTLPPLPSRPSGVMGLIKRNTFRADVKWFVLTIGIGVGGWAKLDANAQAKVDALERRETSERVRLEIKVDAILVGLHIPIPEAAKKKDGGE